MKNIFSKNIRESFNQFSFRLIVPDILFFVIGAILLVAFGSYTGLSSLPPSQLYDHLENSLAEFFVSLALLLIVGFVIGARLKAFKLQMILNSINEKTKGIIESYKESKKYFWKVIGLKIISFITLLIGVCIAIIFYMALQRLNEFVAVIFGIAVIFAVALSLFFRDAALFRDDLSPAPAIKESFKVFSRNKFMVLFIALFIFLINLVWGMTNTLIPSKSSPSSSIISLIYIIVVFLISAWSHLFIFNSYYSLKKAKHREPLTVRKTNKKATKKTTKKRSRKKTKQ